MVCENVSNSLKNCDDLSVSVENLPLLDRCIEHLTQFDVRRLDYADVNRYCGSNLMYDHVKHKLFPAGCNCWNCAKCRPAKMRKLLDKVVDVAQFNDLTRHLIITVKGKGFRSKVSADDSFAYVSRKFNEFRFLFKREFGFNLSYIVLPRSQKDGYCHLHALVSCYIPKGWLDKTLASIGLGWGFIKFVDVQRLGGYLSTYWYKEHEWFIPVNKRHYSCSRNLKLNVRDVDGAVLYSFILLGKHVSPEAKYSVVRRNLAMLVNKPPPLEFFLEIFYEKLHAGDFVEPEIRLYHYRYQRFCDYNEQMILCDW